VVTIVDSKAAASRRERGEDRVPRRMPKWALKLGVGLCLLGAWELGVRTLAPDYVARPSRTIPAIPDVLGSSEYWTAAMSTIGSVVLGLAIALVVGGALGVLIGRLKALDLLTRFYVSALYSLPIISLLPLLTLWFGYSGQTRLILVVIACGLPIVFNVAEGARSIPGTYLEVSRAYRARELNILAEVVLPAAMPYLIAGINLAVGRALVAAVVAEFLTAINGLGFFVLFNSRSFNQDVAMVAVLTLSLFGALMHIGTRMLTSRLTPWYQAEQ
jgi:ABC-type nitrate/sulfonate/bicarbonate transport system permease component